MGGSLQSRMGPRLGCGTGCQCSQRVGWRRLKKRVDGCQERWRRTFEGVGMGVWGIKGCCMRLGVVGLSLVT